ncbi:MAG: glycoside hydrolase family 65 protein [Lachnospiraceae bacterium]
MQTNMNYERASEWILAEDKFDENLLGKTEAVMCMGNGYMGIRSAAEESYRGEIRNCFVAGTFNKADRNEVSELPNAADVINAELVLDGEHFYLTEGKVIHYQKYINLNQGELVRKIDWLSPRGNRYALEFRRFVSLDNLHLVAQKITICPLTDDSDIKLHTCINGRVNNSGAGHFEETQKRFYDRHYMQYLQTTTESRILFVINSCVRFLQGGEELEITAEIGMSRRSVFGDYQTKALKNQAITIEKISTIHTTRDYNYRKEPTEVFQKLTLEEIKELRKCGYDQLLLLSVKKWEDYWEKADIRIICENERDQLAIRFAQYHLRVMAPFHDDRMNIGAKGLSGERYKGHIFWDSEIFILPYFIFQFPEVAGNLIKYRYYGLEGARRKACSNGYEGAQFPWEAAWIEDGEVTPGYGDVDIVTGMPQRIWTGDLEQHITADVIYGLWQYYQMTGDQKLMDQYGYEMIFETACFWCSRLEEDSDGQLHINNVIGPDEYKEHVDDNAYTNYMAYWNINKAIKVYEELEQHDFKSWSKPRPELDLPQVYLKWKRCIKLIYLPMPREDGVVPQDRSYLSLKEIDLSKYKSQDFVLGIYRDYNAGQLDQIQVTKQADVLMLMFLLENHFTQEVKVSNWNYYEPKTLHDSSLSLSTHCILANDIGKREMAYDLFQKLYNVDLGPYMKSSNDGIHAGAIGGIWKSVVLGFGGVRLLEDELRIRPALPKSWRQLSFTMIHQGARLKITVDHKQIAIKIDGKIEHLEAIEICGIKYQINRSLVVNYCDNI